VALTAYPFDGQTITEHDYSHLFSAIGGSGIVPTQDDAALQVEVAPGTMNVTVRAGDAIVRGYYVRSTSSLTVTLPAAAATYTRIDSIVLAVNIATNSVSIYAAQGNPDGTPPTLATDPWATTFELNLGNVHVPANVGTLPADAVHLETRQQLDRNIGFWTNESRPQTPPANRVGFNTSTGKLERWNGAEWKLVTAKSEWTDVTGKPATFPPDAHTHPAANVEGLSDFMADTPRGTIAVTDLTYQEVNGTGGAWVDLATPSVTVQAKVGDWIQVDLTAFIYIESHQVSIDVRLVGVGDRSISGNAGPAAWYSGIFWSYQSLGGSFLYQVQAPDLVNGAVTLKLRALCGGLFRFDGSYRKGQFIARNLGRA
jgi:hypothetical protein